MNRSLLIGAALAVVLFKFGLFGEVSWRFFFDMHALVVVFVGTMTAGFFSAPPGRYLSIFAGAFQMLFYGKPSNEEYITSIVRNVLEAAKAAKVDRDQLARVNCNHPFLKEGLTLVADGLLSEEEIYETLDRRKEFFQREYLSDANTLQTLAKFPPAFGLLGAVTGMIGMMSHLQGESDHIGQSMAVALVATFWGICAANVLLLPLSDYYKALAEADEFVRDIIIDAVLMVKRRDSAPVIEEKMNSYLKPAGRTRGGSRK